jgi:transposase
MEVLYPRCGGLDVHEQSVVACVRLMGGGKVQRIVETFGTTTRELLRLLEWLQGHGVTHVAMESTGVYWKPVWHLLEGHFTLVLGNPKEMRNVPGRKSDVQDAVWIADLLAHGLIRSSYVPAAPIQALRDLTRTRTQLSRERARHVQRIQKVLEDANVKLTRVLSDILGLSGRAILQALIRGEQDPARLAALAHPRVKATPAQLAEALEGRVTKHHRFLLQLHLGQVESLEGAIQALEGQVEAQLAPFRRQVEHLLTMPGIHLIVAAILLAEIGVEMKHFPTAGHLVAWACLCPQQDESAGKRRNTRTRKQRWLKTALVQAAWAAVKKRDSYLHAQFVRLRARRGAKKAIVAVAASMLTAAYHMLRDDEDYQDLGADYFHKQDREKAARQLVRRLRNLGYEVEVHRAA